MPNKLSRYCEGVMEACWLLALIAPPLFFNTDSNKVFEPDKVALVRSLALLMLAAWVVKFINEGSLNFRQGSFSNRSRLATLLGLPLVAPVGAFAFFYLVSTFFSVAPYTSWLGSYERMQGTFSTFSYIVFFAAVAVNLRQRAQVERIITAAILTGLAISLYSILQRFQMDPMPWNWGIFYYTDARTSGTMGNPIFVGAYLIMPIFAALGRVVTYLQASLSEAENQRSNVMRAMLYLCIVAANLSAIFLCNSRGPWLGLLAGLFFFFFLLALFWRKNLLAICGLGLASLAVAFLIVLNIPNGPLEPLRVLPGLERFSSVLGEVKDGTGSGQTRVLIWRGVVKLLAPHPPLEFPDGQVDRLNPLRPLVGYGPEALSVTGNRFFSPQLGGLDIDRSHNETFDALVFNGGLGLVALFWLFIAIFYYALLWLGLVTTSRRPVFLALLLGGGAAGAAGLVSWQGPEFFGIGLPFGMLLGLISFLAIYALLDLMRHPPASESQPALPVVDSWRGVVLISLLSAIVAHFTEIQFGIAVVSSRTYFWIFTGLMLAVGTAIRTSADAKHATAGAQPLRRKARLAGATAARSAQFNWGPVWASVGMVSAILITMGIDFISNSLGSVQTGVVLAESLSALQSTRVIKPYGILGLLLITWLISSLLATLEETSGGAARRPVLKEVGLVLGLSLGLAGLAWFFQAGQLAINTANARANGLAMLLSAIGSIANLLTGYYLIWLLLILGWAVVLPPTLPDSAQTDGLSVRVILVSAGLPVLAIIAVVIFNLRVIQADIFYKNALGFYGLGQPQAAIPLFQAALERAPYQAHYYPGLARAYQSLLTDKTDPAGLEQILGQAETTLKKAQKLNPLYTEYTADLARLQELWASRSPNSIDQQKHYELSDQYYRMALRLSPNNGTLNAEWSQINQHLGDLYSLQARSATDPSAQQDFFKKAIDTYLAGLSRSQDTGLYLGLASAYEATNQYLPAIEQYRQLAVIGGAPGMELWLVYRRMAELYLKLDDPTQARALANEALKVTPVANTAEIESWISTLP